jgi:Tfp pilus assembly protein PilO
MHLNFEELNLRIFLTTRRNLAIAIVLGVVGAGLVLFAVLPQAQQAYELYEKNALERPKLEKLQTKLNQLKDLAYTPEYAQIGRVNAALPSKKPLLELLTGLNNVATISLVSIDTFELNPGLIASEGAELSSAASGPYDRLTVKLQLTGTFESIQEFMIQLERISPFTTITSLTLSDGNVTDDGILLQSAEMLTETYYFTQPIRVTVDQAVPKVAQAEQEVLRKLEQFSVTDLPQQTEVQGGGLDDLFGVESLF